MQTANSKQQQSNELLFSEIGTIQIQLAAIPG